MLRKTFLRLSARGALNLVAAITALCWADYAISSPINTPSMFHLSEILILAQNQPSPKTESILRKTIEDLQQGKPDFDMMEPGLQQVVKEQSRSTADIYRHLGAFKMLKYIGTRDGADMYRGVYEHAAVTYTIRLSDSGKINALLLQPAFPWE